ncbi:2-amino-4-hydroxy-6-hydroxymethyldihydropteridine pyrophosphokinase [Candidatus Termititenax persephonae]|uniref:2-amino-4-hydroxy-6-hydroxymethyldihydropteridine diphosphokinase n=1 Tax=Candidatus Termititenax persephonae TaxID=2218525 RepID=A0A388TJ02_9BACT|nr:2-amino-4-hydroxy-6-hydroxymethyldihydropteridine pyrophosphokinase [Candidatus Termititenax persephonae]
MNAFLGLGSNLGDREQNLCAALAELGKIPGMKILQTASFYDTAPVGYAEQPNFLNTAARIETSLTAHALLSAAQDVEKKLGRAETFRWGPRLIDIDILAYGDEIIDTEDLHVPHLELPRRGFVLEPLCEIAPDFKDARGGQTYRELFAAYRSIPADNNCVQTNTPEDTAVLAQRIAKQLRPGAVVALNGELGAGKTTFARALVKSLGNTARVVSPTFAILNIYPGQIPVYHFDFYRLRGAADVADIGGAEFIPSSGGITLIEWAEKIPEILPENYWEINIDVLDEQGRCFKIRRY